VSVPAVRLFLGSAVTIFFGIACRGYIFDRSGFNQGCQFGFFEAKFVIFGLFSTPLAFLSLEKGQMKFGIFWPFLAN